MRIRKIPPRSIPATSWSDEVVDGTTASSTTSRRQHLLGENTGGVPSSRSSAPPSLACSTSSCGSSNSDASGPPQSNNKVGSSSSCCGLNLQIRPQQTMHQSLLSSEEDLTTRTISQQQHQHQQQQQQLQQQQQQPPQHRYSLQLVIESFCCWCLALACLTVSGYYYWQDRCYYYRQRRRIRRRRSARWWSWLWFDQPSWNSGSRESSSSEEVLDLLPPLTVSTQSERHIPLQMCYESIIQLLHQHQNQLHEPLTSTTKQQASQHNDGTLCDNDMDELRDTRPQEREASSSVSITDDELAKLIQHDLALRRHVSLIISNRSYHNNPKWRELFQNNPVCLQLHRIYPQLLAELSSQSTNDVPSYQYEISLIVPYYTPASSTTDEPSSSSSSSSTASTISYSVLDQDGLSKQLLLMRDDCPLIRSTLQVALQHCCYPSNVQVIAVHSSDQHHPGNNGSENEKGCGSEEQPCNNTSPTNDTVLERDSSSTSNQTTQTQWGSMSVLHMSNQGRGPCLNYGAQHAQGRLLVFCHADTKLPQNWDVLVQAAMPAYRPPFTKSHDMDTSSYRPTTKNPNSVATAFSFSVDATSRISIPGMNAVITTVNWRSKWYSLPYGDQCLAVPATVFQQLGGYPDIPLMEDYDFITCLRQRSFYHNGALGCLTILPQCVECSARRWQRYGAWYVTRMNSTLVHAYQSGTHSPHDIYREYYGVDLHS